MKGLKSYVSENYPDDSDVNLEPASEITRHGIPYLVKEAFNLWVTVEVVMSIYQMFEK